MVGNDESAAASSVVAFLVAGTVFIGSVGSLLLTAQDASSADTINGMPNGAAQRLQSDALADLLVASPGFHMTANGDYVEGWSALNADELGRLGLREQDSTRMDFDKFQNLRRASLASANDGLVNYPDARTSLGLDDTDLDFHVRAFPSLRSVRELLAQSERDPNLRVTYIADYDKVTGHSVALPTVGPLQCTASGSKYTLSNTIANTGDTTTVFIGSYEVELGSGAQYEDRSRTFELAPGASSTLSIDVPALSGRACSGDVELELRDVKSKLEDHDFTLSAGSVAPTTVAQDLWSNPGKTYYEQGQNVVLEFDGDLPTKNNDPSVLLSLTVTTAGGTVVHGPQNILVTKGVRSVTIPAAAFDSAVTHDYVSTLIDPAAGVTVTDRIVVVPADANIEQFDPADATVDHVRQASVAPEAGFIEDLVDRFCPFEVDSDTVAAMDLVDLHEDGEADAGDSYAGRCAFKATTPLGDTQLGDVFPDQQDIMNDLLPERLIDSSATGYDNKCSGNTPGAPRYDIARVLVVGSNVDHNAMTSADAKYAVCEWVYGGGTLIVFGSEDQHVAWLEPVFKAAITSSSTALTTPDASHPILNRADVLAYDGYDTRQQVWAFNGQTAANQDELLTNVVASGASDSILTISNPGAFGDGTVILTTWLPYDLFNAGPGSSQAEGLRVVNNFLMQGYRDLFLDYGPSIPTDARQAAAAQRVVDIQHPEFEDPITLTLFVYVF